MYPLWNEPLCSIATLESCGRKGGIPLRVVAKLGYGDEELSSRPELINSL